MSENILYKGRLKSFSPKDGYGFITCDELYEVHRRDVYVHGSLLPPDASAGCIVRFHVAFNLRGQPQASYIDHVELLTLDYEEAATSLRIGYLQFDTITSRIDMAKEVRAVVFRSQTKKFGVDVQTYKGDSLRILKISGGTIQRWNELYPHLRVRVGDLIKAVNGVETGAQELLEECKRSKRLDLLIQRLEPPMPNVLFHGDAPKFRVVTWNVLASAYASLKVYPEVDPICFSPARRRAQISAALALLQADIICLQEVDCEPAQYGIGDDFDFVQVQRPKDRADGSIIAWRKSRFELGCAGHKSINFDDRRPPDCCIADASRFEGGQIGLIVELRLLGDLARRCITVANTHLAWEPSKQDVRNWHINELTNEVNRFSGPRHIVCGDLNSPPGAGPHQIMSQGFGMHSVYGDLETQVLTNSNANAKFADMIDYIWFVPKWFRVGSRLRLPTFDDALAHRDPMELDVAPVAGLRNNDSVVPTFFNNGWPSDHLALAADFELTIPLDSDENWDDF
eukprot:TRINITY_DN20954_c0_g1_i1.p1 TRINITY_DN20954_c0_g1~~TRINITY_DN20954_c0_g1_i1.p1  ORF type:complete len:512 (-),score=86.46 TRINITY_DN20954_c0_g1_i1:97-1632(-)